MLSVAIHACNELVMHRFPLLTCLSGRSHHLAVRFIHYRSNYLHLQPLPFRTYQLLEAYKMSKQKHKLCRKPVPPPEYVIVEGVRYIKPYVHEYSTCAKGRWINRKVLEVLTTEFGGHSPGYWEETIETGRLLINDKQVTKDYVFRDSDVMVHKTHRHEPPVMGTIELVGETEDLVAVCKPASMPMHACGSYFHNSMMNIIAHEKVIENQPNLLLVHRLDKVTSGVVILAKNPSAATRIQNEIMGNATTKTYLARVKGVFPKNIAKLRLLPECDLAWDPLYKNDGTLVDVKSEKISKKRKRTDGDSLEVEDALVNEDKLKDRDDCDVYSHPEVGYGYDASGALLLKCAIGVVSHRDGVHSNNPMTGKPAFTQFRSIGYSEADDTTLVECQPITGRTHQIRLHLQLLGNPIANDPCYGGELFYGDVEKKNAAISAFRQIKLTGKQPLGNVAHVLRMLSSSIADPSIEADSCKEPGSCLLKESAAPDVSGGIDYNSKQSGMEGWSLCDDTSSCDMATIPTRRDDETDSEFLTRTCRYCASHLDPDLERSLHCDGIWLHALQYEGNGWKFTTALPTWALQFYPGKLALAATSNFTEHFTACTDCDTNKIQGIHT